MIRNVIPKSHSLKIILLASAFGASLAVLPATAQDYPRDGYVSYHGDEEVIVRAPHWRAQERSSIGAPIETVSLSEPVRFDDLDLNSDRDVYRLEGRIHAKARALCRRLDVAHPIDVSDTPQTCYRDAVADAMDQVEAAVDQARATDARYAPPPYREDDNDR
ncbi:MAG TPA: UrcA family protein [Rhizomicrobium sp.]|jgi:UrcA family protein